MDTAWWSVRSPFSRVLERMLPPEAAAPAEADPSAEKREQDAGEKADSPQ